MSFDMSSPRLVLAGTAYGECRGGGRTGMENVLSVVINRWRAGWAATPLAVCLATRQFSCWDDANRAAIVAASMRDQQSWDIALSVAASALEGTLPVRTGDADSYYALSMARPPYWARRPALHVCSDRWHSFWRVHPRPAADAPTTDAPAADALNDAEYHAILEDHS